MTSPVYLDHAATTPVRPEVIDAMASTMRTVGNASSLHTFGRAARRVVEESREQLAEALGATPSEVIFTSGGTESNNLALQGAYHQAVADGRSGRRLLIGSTEHHATIDPVEHLVAREDAEVAWVDPDAEGVVQPQTLAELVQQHADETVIASVMWANNEVGAVSPIGQLAAIADDAGVLFHTDAVQAVGHLPIDFGASGAHLLSLSAHKFGGPTGVGALLVRRDVSLMPLTYGGGQERQLRSGTLDVAGIRGLALAATLATAALDTERKRIGELRDRLVAGALGLGLGISVSGPYAPGDLDRRLPGNAHLRVPGCDGDSLLYLLDAAGIECSTGSACQAGVPQPSHVLLAMGMSQEQARGAIRLTLGHTSTEADVDAALAALPSAIKRARRARRAHDADARRR